MAAKNSDVKTEPQGRPHEAPLPDECRHFTTLFSSPSTTGTTTEHTLLIYSTLRTDSAIKRLYSR